MTVERNASWWDDPSANCFMEHDAARCRLSGRLRRERPRRNKRPGRPSPSLRNRAREDRDLRSRRVGLMRFRVEGGLQRVEHIGIRWAACVTAGGEAKDCHQRNRFGRDLRKISFAGADLGVPPRTLSGRAAFDENCGEVADHRHCRGGSGRRADDAVSERPRACGSCRQRTPSPELPVLKTARSPPRPHSSQRRVHPRRTDCRWRPK